MDRELYMTALHVLAKFASGEKADPVQVSALRRNALLEEADLEIDELCCDDSLILPRAESQVREAGLNNA
jgi:hypothetical protein